MHTLHRAIRQTLTASMLASTALLSTPALSASFTWLTSPSLVGHVTFDAFLGNADDQVVNGINTIGAASQFSASNGVYGFFQGTHTAQGSSILGLDNQLFFGSNVFSSISVNGQWNNNATSTFNHFFFQRLNSVATNSIAINHDQSYTDSFVVNDSLSGGRLQVTGSGHYLLNGQDPAALYSGGSLTHFNFVTPLLPNNWTGVAQESQNWSVLDGPFAGVTGVNTLTFYSTDSLSTPREQPQSLGAPWAITGFAVVNGLNATIGNISGTTTDGAATLSNGNTATLNSIELGRQGNGTLTVQGTGTTLSREGSTYSQIVVQGTGNAALNVLDGGKVFSSEIQHVSRSGSGPMDTHVGGLGSELTLSCPTGQDCSPNGIVGLIDLNISNTATSSSTIVDSGGRINIIGKDTAGAGIALTGSSHLTVDGANSEIHITGSKTVQVGSKGRFGTGVATGVGIEQTDTVSVTNGGKIIVENANFGFNGVGVGTGSVSGPFLRHPTGPNANLAPGVIVVDGVNSLIDAGALLTVGEKLTLDLATAVFVDSGAGGLGELVVRNGGVVKADAILIGLSGTLKGNGGTLQGAVENRGIVGPGESPGTLNIQGDFTQTTDGKLVIEIGGNTPGLFDVLNVSGKLTLGGTLEVNLLNGFTPGANDTFNFLTFGSIAGAFDHFILPTFGNGETLHLSFGPNGIALSASAVPIPAAAWLLMSALGGLGLTRRRAVIQR